MPTIISFGYMHVQSALQNAAVFIGETNVGGWDAHGKTNSGHGPVYGWNCLETGTINLTDDGREWFDGIINDQDVKISWNLNM